MRFYKNSIGPGELIAQPDSFPVLSTWVEISKDEYEELSGSKSPKEPNKHIPKDPLVDLQEENKLLKAQLQAQTERSDFIEDCIAEMATMVYGGV